MCGPCTSCPRARQSLMICGISGTTRVPNLAIAAIVGSLDGIPACQGASFVPAERLQRHEDGEPDSQGTLPAAQTVTREVGGSEPADQDEERQRPDERGEQV